MSVWECAQKQKPEQDVRFLPLPPPLHYLERGPFADWQLAVQAKLAVQ